MVDVIDWAWDEDELAHITLDKVKVRVTCKMGNVIRGTGDVVVDSDDAEAFGEKAVGEMGAEESGGSGYNSDFLHRRCSRI